MEKRTGSGGASARNRRLSLVVLTVSLGSCLALALVVASLELSRRDEMNGLKARLEALTMETDDLRKALSLETDEIRKALLQCQNTTDLILASYKQVQSSHKTYDDLYDDYYDSDLYEDDEEQEDEASQTPPPQSKKTFQIVPSRYMKVGGRGNSTKNDGGAATEEDTGKRRRRSIQYGGANKYQVKITRGSKGHPLHNPSAVQARIYVEKDSNGFQEFKQKEDQVNRKSDWGKGSSDILPKAIHFGGETQHYLYLRPHHYKGNSRMFHPGGIFKDWSPANWVRSDSDFYMDNHTGEVTIGSPGLYYVYAQIYYDDPADTCGFKILKNGSREFQCTVTTITPTSERSHHSTVKRNTCYTGGLLRLVPGDKLSVREVEGHRITINEKTKSFFGLFRVAAK